MVLTAQMIRDHLTFKGPMTLDQINVMLNINYYDQGRTLIMLNNLSHRGEVILNVSTGLWKSLVTLK